MESLKNKNKNFKKNIFKVGRVKMLLQRKSRSCGSCKAVFCHNPLCSDPWILMDCNRYKCAQCLGVYYCSSQCQKADWRVHRQTCTPWKSVSIFDLARKAECPLTEKFGCHRHPKIKLSGEQEIVALSIHRLIWQLDPLEPSYRLSCQCQTHVSKTTSFFVCIAFYNNGCTAVISAVCGNIHCKQNDQISTLFLLQRISHIDGEAYTMYPSSLKTPTKNIKPEFINVSSKAFSQGFKFPNFEPEWCLLSTKDCSCGIQHMFPVLKNWNENKCMLYNKEEMKWELK